MVRALLLLVLASTAVAQESPTLIIAGVNVIDPERGVIDADTTIVIRDERIVAVGSSPATNTMGARVIDGRGKYLIPGLWDAHVHLSYARESALPALVANGVTYVRDMGGRLADIDAWRKRIATGQFAGPLILRAGPILNAQSFHEHQLAVTTPQEGRAAVRALHEQGVDFIKLHRRTSREVYFAIADEARRAGLPFVGHIPMTIAPIEVVEAGQTSIEHAATLFEGTFATREASRNMATAIARWRTTDAQPLLEAMRKNGTFFTPTLVTAHSFLRALDPGWTAPQDQYVSASAKRAGLEAMQEMRPRAASILAEWNRLLPEHAAVTRLMSEHGIPLLVGSDLAVGYAYAGLAVHEEMQWLVAAGVTPLEALRAATINPARLFPALDAGQIAPGKRADLVLLDANPLEDINNTTRISAVILRGRALLQEDLQQVLTQAADLAARN